jgi:molybdopterin/thiamine biosynthesis adenylyltransferase
MSALQEKTALVIGAGSLGGPAALTLASAGVARIVLVAAGDVETPDPGEQRGAAAVRRLTRLFPELEVEVFARGFDDGSAGELVRSSDVVVDASSHFPTMFLANDAAVAAGKALAHGGLLNFTVQLLTVLPGVTGSRARRRPDPRPARSVRWPGLPAPSWAPRRCACSKGGLAPTRVASSSTRRAPRDRGRFR